MEEGGFGMFQGSLEGFAEVCLSRGSYGKLTRSVRTKPPELRHRILLRCSFNSGNSNDLISRQMCCFHSMTCSETVTAMNPSKQLHRGGLSLSLLLICQL